MSLIDRALAQAAERDRRRAEVSAQRRIEKIADLRREASSKLSHVLEDEIPDDVDLKGTVAGWEVVSGAQGGGMPVGLVGELEGIPLGILPDPERTYGTAIVAARFGDVDGARYLATSVSTIRTLADVPDALEELDRNLADEADAIRADLDDDRPETSPGPEPERPDALEEALRRLDADAVRIVAEHDAQLAATVIAPAVTAIALDRIATELAELRRSADARSCNRSQTPTEETT